MEDIMNFDCIIKCAGPADAQEVRRLYYLAKNLRSSLFIRPDKVAGILEDLKRPSSFASRRERIQSHLDRVKSRKGSTSGEARFLEERLAALDKEQQTARTQEFAKVYGAPAWMNVRQALNRMDRIAGYSPRFLIHDEVDGDMAGIEKRLLESYTKKPLNGCTLSLDIETTQGGPTVQTKAKKKPSLTTAALAARCAVNAERAAIAAEARASKAWDKAQDALDKARAEVRRTRAELDAIVTA